MHAQLARSKFARPSSPSSASPRASDTARELALVADLVTMALALGRLTDAFLVLDVVGARDNVDIRRKGWKTRSWGGAGRLWRLSRCLRRRGRLWGRKRRRWRSWWLWGCWWRGRRHVDVLAGLEVARRAVVELIALGQRQVIIPGAVTYGRNADRLVALLLVAEEVVGGVCAIAIVIAFAHVRRRRRRRWRVGRRRWRRFWCTG